MGLPRCRKSRSNREPGPSSSTIEHRQGHVDFQPSPDVRPLSFSFQCGNSQYRINFRVAGDYSKTDITRDSQPYKQIDALVKIKKRVRFQDPPSTRERQLRPGILKSHSKGRPQRPAEDVAFQVARANQRTANEKVRRDEGGYHQWVRFRDSKAAHNEQDPQEDISPADNLTTDNPSVRGKRRDKSRLSSRKQQRLSSPPPFPVRYYPEANRGKHSHFLSPRPIPVRYYPIDGSSKHVRLSSPRPTPVRYYPKDDVSEAAPGAGQLLSPLALVSSNLVTQSKAPPSLQSSKLYSKQTNIVANFTPINSGSQVTRHKSRRRLTKQRKL